MAYRVEINHSAEKELRGLHRVDRAWVAEAIVALADNPRPPGCKKLKVGAWGIRIGDYRVAYDIDDDAELVTVHKIGHRRDVYRDLKF